MEKKEIKSQNEQNQNNNKVFSNKQEKSNIFELDYEMLELKVSELRSDEAIFAPDRHADSLQKFLKQGGYTVENVFENNKMTVKYCHKKEKTEKEFYIIDLGYEIWIVKSCNLLFQIIGKTSYTSIYKTISKSIKYKYHIGELLLYKLNK